MKIEARLLHDGSDHIARCVDGDVIPPGIEVQAYDEASPEKALAKLARGLTELGIPCSEEDLEVADEHPRHTASREVSLRRAGAFVGLAVKALLPHHDLEEVAEAIDGLKDGMLEYLTESFDVTVTVGERRRGFEWTYQLVGPDGRRIELAEPEHEISVAKRLQPEDFLYLPRSKELRHARGVVLPAAVCHERTLKLRAWPPPLPLS